MCLFPWSVCCCRAIKVCVDISMCIFLHRGRGWGRSLGIWSGWCTVSGPRSALCLAPFCVFLETLLPCVALPGPWDNSQYIRVPVTLANVCVFACVPVCVFSTVQLLVQTCSSVKTQHKAFVSVMCFDFWVTNIYLLRSRKIFVCVAVSGHRYIVMDNN